MSSNTPRANRDVVYCHQCENEWYRDEHGLTCPECQSDFTEIVEPNNDPREDEQHLPPDTAPPPSGGDFDAPDPDEQDIAQLQSQLPPGLEWERTGPNTYRVRGTVRQDIPIGRDGRATPQQAQGQGQGQGAFGGLAGGIMGLFGNALQGVMGAGQQQQPQAQHQPLPFPQRIPTPNIPGRPSSAPGSPPPMQGDQQQPRGGGPFVEHREGPGWSYTMTSSSNSNLFPRNAHQPQPFQNQPDHIEQMLSQMMGNIGAMPMGPGGPMRGPGGMRMGMGGPPPGMHPFDDEFGPGPAGMQGGFIFGGPGGAMHGMPPQFAHILGGLFAGAQGGQFGDAVYSQEALDRIITQLMEQHQTGNAPGPASEAAIKSLPTKTIAKSDQDEGSGRADCSICMDEVPLGETVTELPCHHWFHADCIRAWLGEHDTCPHCRQGIMPKEGEGAQASQPRAPGERPMYDMRSPEFTRPQPVPGAYPFPRQDSMGGGVMGPNVPMGPGGSGTQQNPWVIPDSPTMQRRNSTGGERRRSSGAPSQGGNGMFGRMRDAFGRGSGSGGGDQRG